ncbi:MAG: VOC family protein [Bacteroidia bacterium]
MNLPKDYQQVMPSLIVNGAAAFQQFMTKVFGAREKMIVPDGDSQIMHGEVLIGDSMIMFADSTNEFTPKPAALMIYVKDADATYKKALDEGAETIFAPADKEYGRSAGAKDKWGNSWYITSIPKP